MADERGPGSVQYLRIVVRGILGLAAIIALILLPAARVDYWQGWLFSGALVTTMVISSGIFAQRTDLIQERVRPGPGTKWWDKVFWALYGPSFLAVVVVGSLDTGRFDWTGPVLAFVYVIGYLLYAFSHVIRTWAMWANRFFSSTVRIQMDRDQHVVQAGPYRIVRHPGYVAGNVMAFGSALALGSLYALIPAGIVGALLVARTHLEDRTLHVELDGYSAYAGIVKYRLLPGVL